LTRLIGRLPIYVAIIRKEQGCAGGAEPIDSGRPAAGASTVFRRPGGREAGWYATLRQPDTRAGYVKAIASSLRWGELRVSPLTCWMGS
jgi:hypothetical protein